MNYGRAFFAGVVGGAAMTAVITLVRVMGIMDVNLSMMEGSMITAAVGLGTWLLGFVMHLMISGLIALAYAAGFEHVTHRAGWHIGVGFSLIHSLIAGLMFGTMPTIHPLVPDQMPAPGMFMSNKGLMGVLAFFMLHALYGAIVGAMYHVVHTARTYGTTRHA
ncbi:MAG: hypothetical protein M3R24_06265 [Chloroflexota bacterium]|nr:hypothetical protein [Chloroflexota bacterium]